MTLLVLNAWFFNKRALLYYVRKTNWRFRTERVLHMGGLVRVKPNKLASTANLRPAHLLRFRARSLAERLCAFAQNL
jgi:hypothetical protein